MNKVADQMSSRHYWSMDVIEGYPRMFWVEIKKERNGKLTRPHPGPISHQNTGNIPLVQPSSRDKDWARIGQDDRTSKLFDLQPMFTTQIKSEAYAEPLNT